jgi:hypothetical protein
MGTVDDALALPLRLSVDGNLAPTMPDAHLAGRDHATRSPISIHGTG